MLNWTHLTQCPSVKLVSQWKLIQVLKLSCALRSLFVHLNHYDLFYPMFMVFFLNLFNAMTNDLDDKGAKAPPVVALYNK